ncbi:MAG: amidohydrolase/deacetylase family metallohydrolase, partial [Acidobacteriaceae bacterium]|nr:amidohydrolase/deacetylase family metallohydrolase [Acidobacteriaceae bacterium]
ALLVCAAAPLLSQTYDLVLKGGHIIDPANNLNEVRDIAISGNRIAAVQAHIAPSSAKKVIDATGLYVVPGLVDLHAHVFGYEGSLSPDETALPAGTTTIVDAGGSGWRTFDEFRRTVIARSKTRVLADINIVGAGMVGEPAESNVEDMDPAKTAAVIQQNRDVIVGIKTAHFAKPGWDAIDRAVAAGKIAQVPVMVDDKIFTNTGRTTRDKLLVHLRPGDIHTHMYNDRQLELVNRFNGKLQPYMLEARQRGVLFDLGHGGGSFLWPVAAKAMAQGFPPDTISTDLHSSSIMIQQSDMPNCMSKMMLLGMSLPDAVLRSTVNPAKAIHRYPELGTLGVGQTADIAVLDLKNGVFAFKDAWGAKRLGTKRLECAYTIRNGDVVYQRPSEEAPANTTEIYDLLIRTGADDVAVIGTKIARLTPRLRASQARIVIDAVGYTVRPGLVEVASTPLPDYIALRRGITRVVADAGSAPSQTRLDAGQPADIAIFDGKRCILTIRAGKVVWDSEGLAAVDWIRAGPYTNFK